MRLISFGKSRSSICHNWRRFYNMHTDFMVGTSMWPQNLWEKISWENHFAIVIVGHDVRPTYVTFLQRVCCCWCLLENAHACCQVCLCLYIVCTVFFSSFFFRSAHPFDISFYLTEATALHYSRELASLKPSWCTSSPIRPLLGCDVLSNCVGSNIQVMIGVGMGRIGGNFAWERRFHPHVGKNLSPMSLHLNVPDMMLFKMSL